MKRKILEIVGYDYKTKEARDKHKEEMLEKGYILNHHAKGRGEYTVEDCIGKDGIIYVAEYMKDFLGISKWH